VNDILPDKSEEIGGLRMVLPIGPLMIEHMAYLYVKRMRFKLQLLRKNGIVLEGCHRMMSWVIEKGSNRILNRPRKNQNQKLS
jgi:hypothetical protein